VIAVLALLALGAWAVPAMIVTIVRDGYRRMPTRSQYESSRPT
jgi:hypothetical protein